jgi:hypothetical protein
MFTSDMEISSLAYNRDYLHELFNASLQDFDEVFNFIFN